MSADTFEKLRAWLPAGCDAFFAGYGEPLLHNDHEDFIRKLSDGGISTSIMTNGKLLSRSKVRKLYAAGLYKLQISVLPDYEEADILKYVDMIDREFYGRTQFNFLYDETTEVSKLLVSDLKKNGFKVWLKRVHSRGGELYSVQANGTLRQPCGTFLRVTYIDTNGAIQICSNDINGKYNIGDIDTLTFEALMDKKRELSKGNMIAPVCDRCDDEYTVINLRKYEETV